MHRDDNRASPPVAKPLPLVDLVIPVLNEVKVLEKSVAEVRAFLAESFPYPGRIVIAENGSADGTAELAQELADSYDNVRCVLLSRKGRGRALRTAWTQSDADIVAYTDVDLSTELSALEPMCRAIHEEGYDLATGSRLMTGSKVTRCLKREFISRAYNLVLRAALKVKFSDAQCGFKAVSRRFVNEVIPLVEDQAWFFDTELLVLGERLGYRLKEVPVTWIEDLDSRVKIIQTAIDDLRGVARLRRALKRGGLKPVIAPPEPASAPSESAVEVAGRRVVVP